MSRILKPYDQRAVEHLKRTLGNSVILSESESSCVVAAPEVPRIVAEQAVDTIEAVRQDLIRWLNKLEIPLRSPSELITVGLFDKKSDYEDYLKQEGLEGLTGSLGATHPIRRISLALCAPLELKTTSPHVVIAHESIHLFALKTGLCPGWDAWPRWLHEGLAMLGDHTAEKHPNKQAVHSNNTTQTVSSIQQFGSRNDARASVWKKSAPHLDIPFFLRRDLTKNPLSNDEDYAASWAITAALSAFQHGKVLQSLIQQLANGFMQYDTPQSIEVTTADWPKSEIGEKWPEFVKLTKNMD